MVFSSIVFIFRFLPIALLIYYLVPNKYKNIILIFISLIFYSWGEGKYFLIMIASIMVDYVVGILLERNKRKSILFISLIFNIGILFIFKYINFFIGNLNEIFNITFKEVNIALPLGISFYTFQTMSYSIDVFKGKIKAERNIINFATYVTLFPQLIAGPIVKYSSIANEIKKRNISKDVVEEGVRYFILGLGSKVIIANNIGMLWNEVEKIGFDDISTQLAWLGILAFALQVYFDFNGYSLMAIGLGKMLGFTFPKNFNYPYVSKSISEFWRRWHITLGNWFKEYVYIPLGGNRVSIPRTYINLFIVWFLTGFWHGANYNFILWGMFFFLLISIEKLGLNRLLVKNKLLAHLYTLFFLLLGWSIFAITDLKELAVYMEKLFVFSKGTEWIYYIRNYGITFIIAIIFSIPSASNIYNKVIKSKVIDTLIIILVFFISISYLVDSTYNPFLYFRF